MTTIGQELLDESLAHLAAGRKRIAIIGVTPAGLELRLRLRDYGATVELFDPGAPESTGPALAAWSTLRGFDAQVVVIASDADKETLLRAVATELDEQSSLPRVVLAGLAHQDMTDALFAELEQPALVPSYATGHPFTRVHLFNCLRAAAANGLGGTIVELGAFKGGTSVWLARAAAILNLRARVVSFDSWDGFPKRRSVLDMYEHPRCVFRDIDAVRRYTEPYGIELVAGDIAETVPTRLKDEAILLAFIDTDNFSGTRDALDVILPNLVRGGSIVFDHFWTTEDYLYTVGERIAAEDVLADAGLLNLHGTGVFVRIG